MSRQPQIDDKPSGPRVGKLLQSGIIFSAISFLTNVGNLAFQAVMGRHLKTSGDYGSANSVLNAIMPLLGLMSAAATFAVTHYIAHFNAVGDAPRLQGLLAGCRKFLFHLTILGSALAVVVIVPLGSFFHYNGSLMLVTLGCTLLGLWASLATALCQGLAWFKRLALIGFIGMVLRIFFGWFITLQWPSQETAVLASAFAYLASLILFFWKKDLSLRGEAVSPWNREFVLYLVVSAAYVVGNYCFTLGDLLVMQHYFPDADRDAYTAAERLAAGLPTAVGPLLAVFFTYRSIAHTGAALREQLKLIGLYAVGLVGGAIALFVLRIFCLKLIGKYSPEAAAMIGQLSVTMIFVGLLQAIGTWALASRWSKISLFFGMLGIGYLLTLLVIGKNPAALLQTMPVAAGIAFAILFFVWLVAMRRHKPAAQS
ncbi:MAG TPA: hypothetical protein VK769_01805 [Verrucomicrobiae bacterium]|nr:hypothetical protein [Verrucomicrobiae bacterium]